MKKNILSILALCLFIFSALQAQNSSDFYSTEQVQEIKLEFEQENWRYLMDSLRYNGDNMLVGNVTINGDSYTDVGVRYWLGASFQPGSWRNDLHIQLDLVKSNQKHANRSSIEISSAVKDPSLVREVLGYNLASK